ncbi:MAG TPA: hypothetical protein PLS94_10075, partial [Prolixibacteraceae bacterium]|nr:hypothetical protein [Prolixibacteraceae bacterium]
GATEKAQQMLKDMAGEFSNELRYYFGFSNKYFISLESEVRSNLFFLNEMVNLTRSAGMNELHDEIKTSFDLYYNQLLNQM